MMLTVNTERWHQTVESLREQALSAEHHRTREQSLAIYEVSKGKSATQVVSSSLRLSSPVHPLKQ